MSWPDEADTADQVAGTLAVRAMGKATLGTVLVAVPSGLVFGASASLVVVTVILWFTLLRFYAESIQDEDIAELYERYEDRAGGPAGGGSE